LYSHMHSTHLLSRQVKKVKESEDSFSLFQWNILARCYSDAWKHPQCPKNKISFDDRKKSIGDEILSYDADLINLQEVDQRDLDFFAEKVCNEKYGFTYVKR